MKAVQGVEPASRLTSFRPKTGTVEMRYSPGLKVARRKTLCLGQAL